MNGFGRGEEKRKENKLSVISRETVGMTLLLFSLIAFVIVVSGPYIFGSVGTDITAFFLGVFGFAAYPLLVLLAYISVCLAAGKNFIAPKWLVRGGLVVLAVFLIVHTATADRFAELGYGGYLSACWGAAGESASGATGGGVILGVVVYPVQALLTSAGAYVVFSLLTALALYFFLLGTRLHDSIAPSAFRRKGKKPSEAPAPRGEVRTEGARPYPGGVAFGDLAAPTRNEIPAGAYGPYDTARAQGTPEARPAENGRVSRAASREILFGSDPASNYRNNLIYDRNSYFNTHARGSNVMPSQGGYPAGYADGYSSQVGEERPAMPRRVTEEHPRPAPYEAPEDDYDANYPQTPSYRAPTPPTPPAPPAAPARDFLTDPQEKPAQAEPSAFAPREPAEPPRRDRFLSDPAPAPAPEEKPEETPSRDSSFRSLFSRPVEEHIHVEDPASDADPRNGRGDVLGRDDIGRADLGRGTDLGRGDLGRETPDLGRGDLGRGADLGRTTDLGRGAATDRTEDTGMPPSRFASAAEDEPEEDSRVFRGGMRQSAADLFDSDDAEDGFEAADEPSPRARGENTRSKPAPAPAPEQRPAPKKHIPRPYVPPRLERLTEYPDTPSVPHDEIESNSSIIVDTLAGFRVDAQVIRVTVGPTVTRYDLDIPRNTAIQSVIRWNDEIAMRLHASEGVNMYSNSEIGAISIEVPNKKRATVGIRQLMEAPEFSATKAGELKFVIGKDVEGRYVYGDIAETPHLLVAGSTGSGKSVCLNTMLVSLITKYSPEDLRLILIDPKQVEFAVYEGIPHLMVNEIITDPPKAVKALNWAIAEMERRNAYFRSRGEKGLPIVPKIDDYNKTRTPDEEKFPKIVIVFDELADFMAVAKKDIEDRIQRLAAKARSAGIHLVLATQRPTVDVITGTIKSNLPSRIAFRVFADVDSRTILDDSGAQKLLGNGDMLIKAAQKAISPSSLNTYRVQGAFISSAEVQGIVDEIKANNESYYEESVAEYINKATSSGVEGGDGDGGDDGEVNPQYIKALGICVKLGQASISLIQRKCLVGYNHAGRIIDWMESMGYITPFDGKAKARDVILTVAEFEEKYGKIE